MCSMKQRAGKWHMPLLLAVSRSWPGQSVPPSLAPPTCAGDDQVRESSCSGGSTSSRVGNLRLRFWLCDLGKVILLL